MSDVFSHVLSLSVSGSALILLMVALRPLFRNRLSRGWQYYLWIIVLLRLAIPYTPSFGLIAGLFRVTTGPAKQAEVISAGPAAEVQPETEGPGFVPSASGQTGPAQPALTGLVPPVSPTAAGGAYNIVKILSAVWLAGAALLLLAKAAQYAVFMRRLRRCTSPVTDTAILADFKSSAVSLGIRQNAALYISPQIFSPMLVGLWKPAVILPATALTADRTGLCYVFRHELTHLRRRDILYKWVAELILCVHWFNPLAYLMTGLIAEACEFSCDEAVASRLDINEKRAYGNALLDTAAEQTAGRRHLLLMMLREDKINMKERLKTILKSGKKSTASVLVSIALAFALLLGGVLLGACANGTAAGQKSPSPPPSGPSASNTAGAAEDAQNEQAVRKLAEDFGKVLKNVSLLAPASDVVKSIDQNYAAYVTPELLAAWKADLENAAPGRVTSSPWPERIDVAGVQKNADGSYTVSGNIVEMTSTEVSSGEAYATRPVTMKAVLSDGHWLISEWTVGAETLSNSVVYNNTDYGFDFTLPKDWKGYTIVTEEWQGFSISDANNIIAKGPKLSIRSPKWTAATPTQDIPIMVFTIDQWNDLLKEKFAVSAAPIPPSELGRNSKYVFALPARYNFAFPAGYEEVEKVLSGTPLQPNENFK